MKALSIISICFWPLNGASYFVSNLGTLRQSSNRTIRRTNFVRVSIILQPYFSCCNCNASRQHTNDLPNTVTQPAAAITYNCENFYGHYDNRKNINVLEPEKSQRNKEAEYPLTGNRLLIGKINSPEIS